MLLKIKIVFLLFFITIISCRNKKTVNAEATVLFKKASEVFRKNYSNSDSLMYAISLLDSSIRLDAQPKFYFTKFQISMLLKRYDLAINSTNGILAIDKNNFMALFLKGIALECSKEIDSAMNNYKLALKSLESTRFETPIFKEHQKIILYALLKDTANFNLRLIEFKERYSGNKEFSAYYESLVQFDRNAYLNSY
jgi:tetratricopeptide (TPR) repeat protein